MIVGFALKPKLTEGDLIRLQRLEGDRDRLNGGDNGSFAI